MSEISVKIFSTQRTAKKADLFDCECIIPVRGGAVYDTTDGGGIIGDNTGDNISEKNRTFCELTTQYWAWKNVDADYYGFCHYRRYLSFSDKRYKTDDWKSIIDMSIDGDAQKKYGITSEQIKKKVSEYDVMLAEPIDLDEVGAGSVYEQYEKMGVFLNIKDVDLLFDIVKERQPHTYDTVKRYFNGKSLALCNMMVMKKEIFEKYNEWLFDILFEFERRADMSKYSVEALRTPGHLAERLLGAYCMYLTETNAAKVGYLQKIFFTEPDAVTPLAPVFDEGNTARIVLSSSLYYSPYCAATVRSIINTASPEHNYDIVILHTQLDEKTQNLFRQMVKGLANISLRFCNVKSVTAKFDLHICEHFSVETYYRLAIKSFLPEYSKIVYLDSDLIVMKDIFELYSTDVSGYAFAGVVDICLSGINNGYNKEKPRYYKERLFIKDENMLTMINAGVLVLNQDFISERYTSQQMLDYAQEGKFELCDQDVLNSLFQDDILYLDPKWNTLNYQDDSLSACCTRFAPKDLVTAYRNGVADPSIVHYASTIKPWNVPDYLNADLFWGCLRETPFYEQVLLRRAEEIAAFQASNATGVTKTAPKQKVKLHRRVANKLFPIGTKRRERLKKLVCFITRKKYVKPDYEVK